MQCLYYERLQGCDQSMHVLIDQIFLYSCLENNADSSSFLRNAHMTNILCLVRNDTNICCEGCLNVKLLDLNATTQ